MSFLAELKKQKDKLKETDTVVTNIDGKRFIEKDNEKQTLDPSTYGFVVDTKPDDIPVLITDFVYIGSQDCTASNVLNKYDIKHVLSLGIEVAVDADCKFVQCLDLPETDIKPVLLESLSFIQNAVDTKENLLVHCNAGVSRSSMVVIGYLIQYKNMTYDDAYSLVKEKRPVIQPNAGFKRQLRDMIPGQNLK